jgi:hypothetical protein
MEQHSVYLYGLIIGCEAAFWVLLVLALAARYLWKLDRLSQALLLSLPAVDVLLLIFTALDLRSGTLATHAHGLATAYVGFTVAFGSVAVRWADQHFAHRFANGPPPVPAPKRGLPALRYEMALWARCIVAWAITLALLVALIAFIDNDAITKGLNGWFGIALISTVLWFVFGPVWSLFYLRSEAPKV